MSVEGDLCKYKQVHSWSCSSGLEEMRQSPCVLDGCGYMTSLALWRVGGGETSQEPLGAGGWAPQGTVLLTMGIMMPETC
jgi:hypothetical protein